MSQANTPKKAFPFYASNLDALEQLPESERAKYALKIVEYGLSDTRIELTPEEKFIFGHIFAGIDQQKKKYHFQQRLKDITAKVLAGPRLWRGISSAEWEQAAIEIKKLKARAHQEVIEDEDLEIMRALGSRVLLTIGLESPLIIDALKQSIAKSPADRRLRLAAAFEGILREYYTVHGEKTMPHGVADIPNIESGGNGHG